MDDARRRNLLQMIGALGAAGMSGWISDALAAGDVPPGLHRLEGTATVNGKSVQAGAKVNLGDRVATGPNSQAIVVLKGDAFMMRAQTVIEVKGNNDGVLTELLIASGKVLSVFAKKPVSVKAASATIGIRGTGAYVEVDPASVYFCLCYGEALVEGPRMSAKLVKTTHHEQPLLLREDAGILLAEPGPFRNHSDAELILLESLVGREPPFMKDGQYPAKKY
jgi:FecR protein